MFERILNQSHAEIYMGGQPSLAVDGPCTAHGGRVSRWLWVRNPHPGPVWVPDSLSPGSSEFVMPHGGTNHG